MVNKCHTNLVISVGMITALLPNTVVKCTHNGQRLVAKKILKGVCSSKNLNYTISVRPI